MNIQALMKQAQNMQKDMMKIKEEIDRTEFTGESSFVTVTVNGAKELLKVKINTEEIAKYEIELLEDMIVVAINDAFAKVDKLTEEKMGKFSNIPGLF